MPSLYGMLASGAMGAAKGVWGVASAGVAGKTVLGAGVGAIYGGAQGYDPTSRIEGAFKGAILGGAAGGMLGLSTTRSASKAAAFMGRKAYGPTKFLAKETGGFAWDIAKRVANHPLAAAGIAGGAYLGATGLSKMGTIEGRMQSSESPYRQNIQTNINFNQQAAMLNEMGQIGSGVIGPPSMMEGHFDYARMVAEGGLRAFGATRTGRFVDSTVGLPQGLHQGRHS